MHEGCDLPAPSRTTCVSPPPKLSRAASILESNHSVRTASITPEISRALLSLSFFIFSNRLRRALPAAVWHDESLTESHSFSIIAWTSLTV